jgi:hypothetical protein
MPEMPDDLKNSRMQTLETIETDNQKTDELIITLIDLISSRDHDELRIFLTEVLIDVT